MPDPLRTLVAGVAVPEPDDPAIAPALRLAARTGATLHLVHVDADADASDEAALQVGMGGTLRPTPRTAEMAERIRAAAERAADVSLRISVLPGRPGEVLPHYAASVGADLLLLAPTRWTGAAGAVMGTASRVLRASTVPILVLRDPLPGRSASRVLFPTDLSEHSARALPRGAALAAALAGTNHPLLRPFFVSPVDGELGPAPGELEQAEVELAGFLASLPSAPWTDAEVRPGSAAREVLREVREWQADLVVLGTHGRRGLPRFFLGSVAETVLRKAPCSALVIPPRPVLVPLPAAEPGWLAAPSWPGFAGAAG